MEVEVVVQMGVAIASKVNISDGAMGKVAE